MAFHINSVRTVDKAHVERLVQIVGSLSAGKPLGEALQKLGSEAVRQWIMRDPSSIKVYTDRFVEITQNSIRDIAETRRKDVFFTMLSLDGGLPDAFVLHRNLNPSGGETEEWSLFVDHKVKARVSDVDRVLIQHLISKALASQDNAKGHSPVLVHSALSTVGLFRGFSSFEFPVFVEDRQGYVVPGATAAFVGYLEQVFGIGSIPSRSEIFGVDFQMTFPMRHQID